jgi:ankyrin repeat protein
MHTLLDAGADPGARDGAGHTALDVAIDQGHGDVVEFMRRLVDAYQQKV